MAVAIARTLDNESHASAGAVSPLANVAYRAARGQRIRWNPTTMRTDHDGANRLLDLEARKGFDA